MYQYIEKADGERHDFTDEEAAWLDDAKYRFGYLASDACIDFALMVVEGIDDPEVKDLVFHTSLEQARGFRVVTEGEIHSRLRRAHGRIWTRDDTLDWLRDPVHGWDVLFAAPIDEEPPEDEDDARWIIIDAQ